MYIPTWPGAARVPSDPGMKIRSPGSIAARPGTARPAWASAAIAIRPISASGANATAATTTSRTVFHAPFTGPPPPPDWWWLGWAAGSRRTPHCRDGGVGVVERDFVADQGHRDGKARPFT